jgi:hypothetical protein
VVREPCNLFTRVFFLTYEGRRDSDEIVSDLTAKKIKQSAKTKVKREQVSDSGSEIEM